MNPGPLHTHRTYNLRGERMNSKQRSTIVLTAALTTSVMVLLFQYFSLPGRLIEGTTQGLGYPTSLVVSMTALLAAYLVAAIPGALLMRSKKVSHFIPVSLFAVVEAFLLSYSITPVAVVLIGLWAWLPSTALLIVASYFATDALFNRWSASFKYKAIAAAVIIALTAFLAEFITSLLPAIST